MNELRILSFDIEEWFHILDYDSINIVHEWDKYEKRIHSNIEKILSFLDGKKNSASFFVLGWIGKKYPEVVKLIHKSGYEIGSHSNMHQLAYMQSKNEFREDVSRSIHILEDLTGEKVKYFRAPGFSIKDSNVWCFEILSDLGIEIDCSVFPTDRAHGGMPSYGIAEPSIINYNGMCIKELPINTHSYLGHHVVFSGGGYFRLIPYLLIKKWTAKSKYLMAYLHPRDFDKKQPKLKGLPLIRRFKSYCGISGAEDKFNKWLGDFNFIDIKTASKMIDWDKVKIVKL